MKLSCSALMGSIAFLTLSACHKTVPIAAATTKAPVAQAAPETSARASAAPANVATTRPPAARQAPQTSAAKMTPQERVTLNDRLRRLEDALFDYNQANIRPDAMTKLKDDTDVIRGILANYPAQKLMIEGYADERGSAEYNLALGDRRATSARQFLGNMGIPNTQLDIISYGKERPVCTQQTEECWQKNRRVHITAAP